jgi:ribose transport system permease protein|tara:strand:+ start:310 stop:1329 length:1020 start_codon:yes stop_codon:yes gene_type:complete
MNQLETQTEVNKQPLKTPIQWITSLFSNSGPYSVNPGLVAAFIIVFIVLSIASPYFLTSTNLMNIAKSLVVVGVAAVGETIVMIAGGFDLSIGSTMAAAGMLAAYLLNFGFPIYLAFGCSILLGTGIGSLNGTIISYFRVNPLITTLGTMAIIRGLAFVISDGREIVITNEFWLELGTGKLAGVPIIVLILLAIFLFFLAIMPRTKFGRYTYAIGSNARAARLSGVSVKNWRLVIYIVCGATAALAGLMLAARTGNARPAAAMGFELDVIIAVILGGTSLAGGRGTIVGTAIGLALIFIINNGLTLAQVPSFWQQVVKGVILIGAVLYDELRRGRVDDT